MSLLYNMVLVGLAENSTANCSQWKVKDARPETEAALELPKTSNMYVL